MKRTTSGLTALAVVALLTACATRYAPYGEANASKLRLTLRGATSAGGTLQPVVNGQCGTPFVMPRMNFYTPPLTDPQPYQQPGTQTYVPPQLASYPRADMAGSPDPVRSDVIELKLAPGRYRLILGGVSGLSNCGVASALDLEPGRQYRVELSIDYSARTCRATLEKLDGPTTGIWRPQPFIAGEVCARG